MITIDFSKRNNLGLCEFLYESIKEQIQTGILKADEKLPSKRALASHLGISIITVQNAYGQLISEGYIYSIEKKGFFVTDISIGNQVFKNVTGQSCEDENFVQKEKITKSEEAKQEEKKWFVNFKSNTTSYEKFPFSQWSQAPSSPGQYRLRRLLPTLQTGQIHSFCLRRTVLRKQFLLLNLSQKN